MSTELVNYACYGALTKEVAETLLGKQVTWAQARIPNFGLRMITHEMMSDAEREVMQGLSRFIIVPDHRYTRGVMGGVILSLLKEETAVLQFFDNSSEQEYDVMTHPIEAIHKRAGEIIKCSQLPAILVARKKLYGKNIGEWRDGQNYDPYEPYGVSGRLTALETAQAVREIFLKSSQS